MPFDLFFSQENIDYARQNIAAETGGRATGYNLVLGDDGKILTASFVAAAGQPPLLASMRHVATVEHLVYLADYRGNIHDAGQELLDTHKLKRLEDFVGAVPLAERRRLISRYEVIS